MTTELKNILTKKRVLKCKITKFVSEIKLSDSDESSLELVSTKCDQLNTELKEIFDKIYLLCDEEEIDKYFDEHSSVEKELDETWLKIKRAKQKQINVLNESKPKQENSVTEVRLPTINLPSFSGNVQDWIYFSDLFKSSVHNNSALSGAQKLSYLKSSLHSEAAKVIQSITISDDNYQTAWSLLEERYSNKRQQVFAHIKKLMSISSIQSETPSAILNLADTASECIRSLEILDQKIEGFADTIITYILWQKLDGSTKLWFEREQKKDELPKLKELIEFLKRQARTLQVSKPLVNNVTPKRNAQQRITSMVTTSNGKNSKTFKCVKCQSNEFHGLHKCPEFLNLSVASRYEFVKKNNICFNCLKFHSVRNCKSTYSCQKCMKKHSSLLHFENENEKQIQNSNRKNEFISKPEVRDCDTQSQNQIVAHSSLDPNAAIFHISNEKVFSGTSVCEMNYLSSGILSTVTVYIKNKFGEFKPLRGLIDAGSMSNFITIQCADYLGIKKEKIKVAVSGLNGISVNINSKVKALISNNSNFNAEIELLCVPKISDTIPVNRINVPTEHYPNNIKLADPEFYKPGKIDVLLGAQIFYDLLEVGRIEVPNSNLKFQNSVFGFIACGSVLNPDNQIAQNTHCGLVCNYEDLTKEVQKFFQLETLGIKDDPACTDEDRALEIFEKSVSYKNKRYEVPLPWKKDWREMNDNFKIANNRLNCLKVKMKRKLELRAQYCETLKDYENKGIIEKITETHKPVEKPLFYLPHQPVFRQSLTTKMRVVFDASSHDVGELSLNDCLWPGPNLNPNLFDLLINFRLNKIALIGDIEKAFLQISLAEKDRDAVRFLWIADRGIEIYRFNRVLFGMNASPFLLAATLRKHIKKFQVRYPTTTKLLDRCLYVDDFIAGADNLQDALEISRNAVYIMSEASMKLRKWSTNANDLMEQWKQEGFDTQSLHNPIELGFDSTKVLGMSWHTNEDCFIVDVKGLLEILSKNENTKRFILRAIGKIFDPLGLLTPYTIRMKCLFQDLWLRKIAWDEDLPIDIKEKWLQWCSEIPRLSDLKIPRIVLNSTREENSDVVEIHCFCDASKKAFGTVIYLRIVKENAIEVNLVTSKSRVAPLKKITLPRLELLGALLAARLGNAVKKIVDHKKPSDMFFWTDSKITLYWIRGSSKRWKSFIANRVNEIQSLTDSNSWFHCPGKSNPADLLTRGISVDMLLEKDLWFKGPPFLRETVLPTNDCNSQNLSDDYSDELKKTVKCENDNSLVTLTIYDQNNLLDYIISVSNNYITIIRILCYVLRFIHNLRNINRVKDHLTSKELNVAELLLIKMVQQSEYQEEIKCLQKGNSVPNKSKLNSLNCFLDESNILRVGGRLGNSYLTTNEKHPMVLPSKHPLTLIIVRYFHLKYLHVGSQTLLYHIRRKFWITNGRNICRKITYECVTCFKNKPVLASQVMGDLPKERVTPSFPFSIIGTDYCGPFYIKFKNQRKGTYNKVYVCIFVCLCTKAIHLDFVSDLTSAAFIACFKRFVSRRGRCSKIFSDNAKNFVGANLELKRLHNLVRHPDEALADYFARENIEWNFIPPKTPNFGGLWEAGVKSFKFHLKRVIGNAHLTLEEFLTVILEIESVLNSRPLSPLSSDFDDFETLSPGHFLIGRPLTSIIEPQLTEISENKLSNWQKITKYSQQIWKLWKRDYLNTLQQRNKWQINKNNINVGSLVLIKDENMPSTKWATGRISEIFLGKDKKVRVVNIRLPNGTILKRNVRSICPLPINEN